MRSHRRTALLALAAAAVAAAAWLALPRALDTPSDGPRSQIATLEPAAAVRDSLAAAHGASHGATEAATGEPLGVQPAEAALIASLESASETVRNGTLLTVIRRAGFVCGDIDAATRFSAGTTGWRVRCRDALVYSVVPAQAGELTVEPLVDGSDPFGGAGAVPPFGEKPPFEPSGPPR